MSTRRWHHRATRIAAACVLLGTPAVAWADPVSLIALFGAEFGVFGSLASLGAFVGSVGSYIAIGANMIYGAMDARRRAAHAIADARNAYNAGLQERTTTALQADPAWRIVYGQARTGGDIVAIFTSDKQGTRSDGSSYTKPDALKHLVIVLAAHEVQDIAELYLDGVALGTLDSSGWGRSGDTAKPITYTRNVLVAAGASSTYGGALAVLASYDSEGYLATGNPETGSVDAFTGRDVTYTLSADGKTITNTSAFAARFELSYTATPGTVRWSKHLGTAAQAADSYLLATVPAQWTAADQLKGLAYVVVTLDLEDQRFQGGPPALSFDVLGRKCFDPRDGATRYTTNPALIARDYLTAPWGFECLASDVDDSYTVAAANACDATITLTEGSTTTTGQATYTCNGAVLSSDSRERVLADLCDSMAGYAVYGARWQILAGAWTAPVMALTDDDLAGQVEIMQAGASLDEVFNGVRGSYAPSASGVVSDFSYANTTFVAADGRELWTEVQLPFTNGAARCRNLARIRVEANRDSQVIRYPAKLTAWPLQVGDRVTVSNAEYGFAAKTYRVTDWQFGLQSPVTLTLQEDAAAIYDQADAATVDPSPNTGLPNPWVVPMLAGVSAASGDANLLILADGTVNLRVKVLWAPTAAAFVADGSGQIVLRWRSPYPKRRAGVTWPGDAADQWQVVAVPGDATSVMIDGVAAGELLAISVRAVNGLGVNGQDVVIIHTVVGKTAKPTNVAALASAVVQGGINLSWATSTEGDYAATEVRFGVVGANWATATRLFKGAASSTIWPWPGQGSYTVLARHQDSSGNQSAAATTLGVVVDAAVSVQWADVGGVPANVRALTGTENLGANLLNASNWVVGSTGSQTTPGGTAWSELGYSAGGGNSVALVAGPDGSYRPGWVASSGSATAGNPEGGIYAAPFAVDTTKPYRLALWFQVGNLPTDGQVYFGVGGNDVNDIPSGSRDSNPYFIVANRSAIIAGRWYLAVGYILPAGYSGAQLGKSALYDGVTGQIIYSGADYKWHAGVTSSFLRVYQYYTAGVGRTTVFTGPRVDILDGSEPSVAALMADAVLSRANTAYANAGTAQDAADAAMSQLTAIGSDSVLSKGEKPAVVLDWTVLSNDRAGIVAQAGAYGLSAATFNTAMDALSAYLTGIPGGWSTTTTDSAINPATWAATWAAAYNAKQALLNAISSAASSVAIAAAALDATAKANAAHDAAVSAAAYAAQAKADLAQANAAAYADGVADAAELAAIAAAQTRADTAQAAAIAAAALDATAKANAARATGALANMDTVGTDQLNANSVNYSVRLVNSTGVGYSTIT